MKPLRKLAIIKQQRQDNELLIGFNKQGDV